MFFWWKDINCNKKPHQNQNKINKKVEASRFSQELVNASDPPLHTSHCMWFSLHVRDFILKMLLYPSYYSKQQAMQQHMQTIIKTKPNKKIETFSGNLILNIWNLDVYMWASEFGFTLQVVKRKRNMACDVMDVLSKLLLFAIDFKRKVRCQHFNLFISLLS